jgi:hypothetical protein
LVLVLSGSIDPIMLLSVEAEHSPRPGFGNHEKRGAGRAHDGQVWAFGDGFFTPPSPIAAETLVRQAWPDA